MLCDRLKNACAAFMASSSNEAEPSDDMCANSAWVVTLFKALAYIALMAFLGFTATSTRDLGLTGVIAGTFVAATALTGLIINRHLWAPAILALAVSGLAGYGVFATHPSHPSAGVALACAVAAFGALFLNASTIAHPRRQRE
ncbi:hypothetical protein ACWGI8_34695 [Streptomyces sp. NPDC054841]